MADEVQYAGDRMRFNLPRLIGITGKAGVGKDTLADYLVRQHGYVKYSLSAPIKRLLNERFGWTDKLWRDREWKEQWNPQVGWRGDRDDPYLARELFSPRSWAQWLGTEVGRTIGGEDVWVNLMEREWRELNETNVVTFGPLPRMVVPDVRFDNEAGRIALLGGVVIRVVRPNATPVRDHVSERGVRDELVQLEVRNDSDIITFLRNCVYALEGAPRGV